MLTNKIVKEVSQTFKLYESGCCFIIVTRLLYANIQLCVHRNKPVARISAFVGVVTNKSQSSQSLNPINGVATNPTPHVNLTLSFIEKIPKIKKIDKISYQSVYLKIIHA
jgi:hypothetical protein